MSIVNNINDMQIGDLIPCKYTANKNRFGKFSELGSCDSEEISDLENPEGKFYFEKVDNNLLVADRIIQNNISWNELNNNKLIDGINKVTDDNIVSISDCLNLQPYVSALRQKMIVYKNELYVCWDNGSSIIIKKYDGNNWTIITEDLFPEATLCDSCSICIFNEELYISCSCYYSSSKKDEVCVKKYDGNKFYKITSPYGITSGIYNKGIFSYNNNLYIMFSISSSVDIYKYVSSNWISIKSLYLCENFNFCEYNGYMYISMIQKYNHSSTSTFKLIKFDGSNYEEIPNNVDMESCYGNPNMIIYNNELYIGTTIQIKGHFGLALLKYNEIDFTVVAYKINDYIINSTVIKGCSLTIYNNTLYIIWSEYLNEQYTVVMKKFDGNNFITIKNHLIQESEGYNYLPVTCVYKNELYCCFYTYPIGGPYILMMKKIIQNNIQYTILSNKEYIKYKSDNVNEIYKLYEWTKDMNNENRIIVKKNEMNESSYLTKSDNIGFRPTLIIK